MHMLTNKTSNTGFTIIELIVIIAVIGILAAIGIVSYGGARQSAARNAADTTAQQVKLKLGEYYTDMNYYPLASVVDGYLRGSNSIALADDFKRITDAGGTYAPTPSGCNNTSTLCTSYLITIPPVVWGGSGANLEIRP